MYYSFKVPNHTMGIQPRWNKGHSPSDYRVLTPTGLLGSLDSCLPIRHHLAATLCPFATQLVNFQMWANPTILFPYHGRRYKLHHHTAWRGHRCALDPSVPLQTRSPVVRQALFLAPLLPTLSPSMAVETEPPLLTFPPKA